MLLSHTYIKVQVFQSKGMNFPRTKQGLPGLLMVGSWVTLLGTMAPQHLIEL